METETHIYLQKGKIEALVWKVCDTQTKVRTDSSEFFRIFFGKVYRIYHFIQLTKYKLVIIIRQITLYNLFFYSK
jgi:hypothetical protein